jgi:hypothetical protein
MRINEIESNPHRYPIVVIRHIIPTENIQHEAHIIQHEIPRFLHMNSVEQCSNLPVYCFAKNWFPSSWISILEKKRIAQQHIMVSKPTG